MKPTLKPKNGDELRTEYPAEIIRTGVRGKYLARYLSGSNIVKLAPDVAAAFASEDAVNEALRKLMRTSPDRADSATEVQ